VNLNQINVDFYTFSGHKWLLGPKRTGVLMVREKLLDTLRPTVTGAYSDDGFDLEKRTIKFHPTAQRYEYATQNDALFEGLGAAVDFLNTIGRKRITDHNRKLAEKFYQGLNAIPGVKICSPEQEDFRTSILAFKVDGRDFRKVASYLTDKKNLRVRVVPEGNVNGVRVSFHVYNNETEVDRLLNAINSMAG
ncbi:MAG: aminotransferase class V-fold PLP-dependent enzyme, partial [bacterium]|nr:aminotransferase class V-fold PLP-dependent enzyme [bacterium]